MLRTSHRPIFSSLDEFIVTVGLKWATTIGVEVNISCEFINY